MIFHKTLFKAAVVCGLFYASSLLCSAATLLDTGSIALSASDPVQIGRLFRTGVASDWSGPKAFPGINNTSTAFHYEAFVVPLNPFPYVQISLDDPSGFLLSSAYLNNYAPNVSAPNAGLSQNYLGDQGSSGNAFGNPQFFQVVVPSPQTNSLVVVVTDTGAGLGLARPFSLLVEGFYDPSFNDTTPPVPEPAAPALTAFGMLGLLLAAGRFAKRTQPVR